MDFSSFIQIPYGLSSAYRSFRTGGQGVARPFGQQTRPPISTLEELSRPPVPISTTETVPSLLPQQSPSRNGKKVRQDTPRDKIGSVRNVRRTGKKKRGRTPRSMPAPQSSLRKKTRQLAKSQAQPKKARKTMGPGVGLGASEDMPINIKSDNHEPGLGGALDEASIYAPSPPATSTRTSDFRRFRYEDRSTASEDIVPIITPRIFLASSTPALRKLARRPRHEPSSSLSPASAAKVRTNRVKRRTSYNGDRDGTKVGQSTRPSPFLSRSKTAPSGPCEHLSWPSSANNTPPQSKIAAHKNPAVFGQGHSPAAETPKGAAELTLAEISNFDKRSKVAQLMAVAPAFSVRELHDLLNDCKGRFKFAKARVLRASEARQSAAARSTQDADGDECMVKIDPNDSFLEWDQDEPAEQEHATPKYESTKSRSRTHRNEYTPNPTSRPTPAIRPTIRPTIRPAIRPAVQVKPRAGMATRKPGGPSQFNSRRRETSSDREFIASDNEVPEVDRDSLSDDGSKMSSTSGSTSGSDSDQEVVYQDAMDLDIDMQPRYAFNAELLHLRKKGLGAFV